MYNPKPDLYTTLKGVTGVTVYQQYPETFNTLPALTFTVPRNETKHQLDGELAYQDIEITVDIWAMTSTSASSVLADLYDTMKTAGYMLTFSSDVPNNEKVLHITTQFKFIE